MLGPSHPDTNARCTHIKIVGFLHPRAAHATAEREQTTSRLRTHMAMLLAGVEGLLGIHRVPEGHVGVYWRGGALLDRVTDPGFHHMWPLLTWHETVPAPLPQRRRTANIASASPPHRHRASAAPLPHHCCASAALPHHYHHCRCCRTAAAPHRRTHHHKRSY